MLALSGYSRDRDRNKRVLGSLQGRAGTGPTATDGVLGDRLGPPLSVNFPGTVEVFGVGRRCGSNPGQVSMM